ncbi:MAG: gamma-glutamyl-gamma-aminobutyrate hydrolase family protein [Alicyclobacillus macrosporangiidus]|uniref:gamma-glutamyl-gamma-aminobutyrate hydrolase family protein n=1 Tax=Alicyclobacillus macrosporangiidus TaxID=392015 RepID=UPI0026EEECC2|nr:gamma-glutamyl-gamma-aminobutyrate hydrolase family protein [Alicyclobacillus macrosporangiidus]MCL6597803.1 gamma-glutamyl-gamma-aminobutyrate hydrolase family protein [Alicyclobacillus macrosporangiidus]
MRPLIGITGTRHVIQTSSPAPVLMGLVCSDDYAKGVEAAGGIPVIIPYLTDGEAIERLADRLDGLLLAGGEDVDPNRFSESPVAGLGQVVPERDELELALIAQMRRRNKPILGICRGIQVLNVAFGGTLYQDLPRQWGGRIQHSQKARRDHLSHSVRIESDSRLAALFGGRKEVRCNSFHHQAVKDVGDGLRPVAWDEEGLIEAVEGVDSDTFVVAVQWHPENLWQRWPEHHGLFRGLVEAAAERRTALI